MSILKNTRLYISGPIEHGISGFNWRTEPIKVFTQEFHMDVFDPFDDPKQQWTSSLSEAREKKDYDTMRNICKAFVRKDLAIVDRCDCLIGYLPKGVCTTGTHHEIINSSNAKKPTLLVCPEGKECVPLWYFGFINHNSMFGSWEDLYVYLREVNAGLHKDNDRWSFTYELI